MNPSVTPALSTSRNNILAALLVVSGMTMISSNDTIMKLSGEELGVGQMLFIRGMFAVLLMSLYIKLSGRPLWPRHAMSRWNWLRAGCECAATICFITSLTLLPIATASSLVWTTPILLTIAAALVLKERVTAGRWLAVAAGFCGVLLVTNPIGDGFSWAMLLPLMAAIFVCFRDLLTRRLDQQLDSFHVVLATLFLVTIAGSMMSVFDWQPVSVTRTAWLSLSAVLLGVGFLFQIRAMRMGELSFIAPFSFSGILVAVFWGYIVWQQLPDAAAFAGIGLIIGAGAYLLTSRKSIG